MSHSQRYRDSEQLLKADQASGARERERERESYMTGPLCVSCVAATRRGHSGLPGPHGPLGKFTGPEDGGPIDTVVR